MLCLRIYCTRRPAKRFNRDSSQTNLPLRSEYIGDKVCWSNFFNNLQISLIKLERRADFMLSTRGCPVHMSTTFFSVTQTKPYLIKQTIYQDQFYDFFYLCVFCGVINWFPPFFNCFFLLNSILFIGGRGAWRGGGFSHYGLF